MAWGLGRSKGSSKQCMNCDIKRCPSPHLQNLWLYHHTTRIETSPGQRAALEGWPGKLWQCLVPSSSCYLLSPWEHWSTALLQQLFGERQDLHSSLCPIAGLSDPVDRCPKGSKTSTSVHSLHLCPFTGWNLTDWGFHDIPEENPLLFPPRWNLPLLLHSYTRAHSEAKLRAWHGGSVAKSSPCMQDPI